MSDQPSDRLSPERDTAAMSGQLPERLFPARYADTSLILQGRWRADECVRLPELVEKFSGIELSLRFERKTPGQVVIDGELKAELQLTCQRCLQNVTWMLDAAMHLAICRNEQDFAAIPAGYEPLEVDEDGGIATREFVEDEVIVRLPAVPSHADISQCDPDMLHRGREFDANSQTGNTGGKKQNPFSILKDI